VFDEAVANLDKESASKIAETINKLRGKATIVFITHQLPESLVVDATLKMGEV
jgi:ATP-binding cassette, subfamily B, bacterial HlyB/CyaB